MSSASIFFVSEASMQDRLCGEHGHDVSSGQTLRCPGSLGLLIMSSVNQSWVSTGHQQKPPWRGKGHGDSEWTGLAHRATMPCTHHHSCSCLAFNFKATCFPEHAFRVLCASTPNQAAPHQRWRSSFHPRPEGICAWILSFLVFLWGSHKNGFDN